MITLRHIERLWNNQQYDRLLEELMSVRPEGNSGLKLQVPAVAAIALLRLEELNQSQTPLSTRLLRFLIAQQQSDGGFIDPATTALCLRALFSHDGQGCTIDRGLEYLANLQKTEGIWPEEPIRRFPADPLASAFILYQLAPFPRFRSAVRFFDAVDWFTTHHAQLDPATRRLWNYASARCNAGVDRKEFAFASPAMS